MDNLNNFGERMVDHFHSGRALAEDPELDLWVNSSSENRNSYEQYRKIWLGSSQISIANKFNAHKAWEKIDQQLASKTVFKQRFRNMAYAVSGMAASLLIVLGVTLYNKSFSFTEQSIQIVTNYGNQSSVVLPDGSQVKLNAGSHLEYKMNRKNQTREVLFNGEGFFEVAKSKIPFMIHTPDGLNIKVLGTKFNLKAYKDDDEIRTTLLEGKVELSSPENKSLVLTPGQIASYNEMTKELEYNSGQAFQDLGWVDNKLYMEHMSLQEVCRIMERWYDVKIDLEGSDIGNKFHYTGVLREESIGDVLDALSKLSEIEYQVNGKNIVINTK